MIVKLVASTADNLCRSARRKYSHDRCKSRRSHGRMLRVPGWVTESFHANATSLLALRSRKVNVSMTTATEVCSQAPAHATGPIVHALAHAAGLATTPGRSTPRCRRRPARPVGSRLVVNAIVRERAAFRLAIPDRNGTFSWRHQNNFADRFADQCRNAALRSRSSLAQCVEFFLTQINLRLLHRCHFNLTTDIWQTCLR